jgi:hypothetical protein
MSTTLTLPVVRVAPDAFLGLELYEDGTALSDARSVAPVEYQFVDVEGVIAAGGTNGATPASPQDVQDMITAAINYARNRPDADPDPDEVAAIESIEEASELSEIPQRMAAATALIRWCRIFKTCND